MFVSGSKVKKTFSMIFLLSRSTSKKHGLRPDQRSKQHFYDFSTFAFYIEKTWSWSDSKVKKTFSLIFLFSRSMSNKHGLGRIQRSKKTFSTFSLSIEKIRTVLVQRSWVESQKR